MDPSTDWPVDMECTIGTSPTAANGHLTNNTSDPNSKY